MKVLLIAGAAAFALSGCLSSLLPEPTAPPSIYRLTTPEVAPAKDTGVPVVRVENPAAARTYNTRDILVVTGDGKLSQAGSAQWSDTIPQLIQDAMLVQLGRSPAYIPVIPVSGARADLRVHLDIREFSAIYDQGDLNAPLANVQVYATVADAATRNFIGSYSAGSSARASDNRVSEIVKAQSVATTEALGEVVSWMNTLDLSNAVDARSGTFVRGPMPPG